jgi:TonB family protein
MLLLPTFNARLQPCPVRAAAAFTPHPQGNFCGQCQRVVQDFSQSTDPVADLAAARAAAPDGRVCGSFAASQVQRPKLTQRLRWFVVALVLVVGQGLTAREALAQVRKVPPKHPVKSTAQPQAIDVPEVTGIIMAREVEAPPGLFPPSTPDSLKVYSYAEQMPGFRGGSLADLVAYIQKNVKWPPTCRKEGIEGRVYASFIVDANGNVRDAKMVKGLHPLLDAETLRVVSSLTGLTPGRNNGKAVKVHLTLPINWRLP